MAVDLCPCVDFLFTYRTVPAGPMRKLHPIRIECAACKKEWYIREVTSNGVMLLTPDLSATKIRKAEVRPAVQVKRVAADDVLDLWGSLTRLPMPNHLSKRVIQSICEIKSGKRGLIVGADVLALAIDRGGDNHIAVVDDPVVLDAIQPVLIRTTLHPGTWKPEYGSLFDGIVIGCALDSDWLMRIKRSLAPDGNVFLLGDAVKHKEELIEAWGFNTLTIGTGAESYCLMVPQPEPLGEGPGTELSNDIKSMGMPACQQCHLLARKMNGWGIDGCREHLNEIIEDIEPRALAWWENTDYNQRTAAWWKSASSALTVLHQAYKIAKPDNKKEHKARLVAMLRVQVKAQVVKAIDQYESKTKNNDLCLSREAATRQENA